MTLELLYECHARELRRFAAGMLPSGHAEIDPDDVMQDVWLRVHQALPRLETTEHLRGWLFTITRNRCLDEIARKRSPDAFAVGSAWADARCPLDALTDRERLRELLGDVAALDQRQREALIGHVIAGERHAEVARRLSVSEGDPKILVYHARRQLSMRAAARALPCSYVTSRIEAARRGGGRVPHDLHLHVRSCASCRQH